MQVHTDNHSALQQKTDQSSVPELIARMQRILTERIERAQDALRRTEEAFSKLESLENKVAALEAELMEVRRTSKQEEIRARKLDAENTSMRRQIARLEDAESRAFRLQQLHQTAVMEVGRTVKVLLPAVSRGFWRKKMPLSAKARLLIANEIVDPAWYLERYPDVAAAGMEAAVHYMLHGAREGRAPKPSLDDVELRK